MKSWGIWGSFVFLLAFGLFTFTANPDVTWDDAGEFVTASAYLGIPHPPGYPLTVLVIKIFQLLVPAGITFGGNMEAMFLSAVTVFLVFCLCRQLIQSAYPGIPAIAVPIFCAFSYLGWRKLIYISHSAESYPLQTIWICLALIFWLKDIARPQLRMRLLTGFFLVLGIMAHLTTLMVIIWWLVWLFSRKERIQSVFLMGAMTFVIFSIYFVFPLRSAAGPAFQWGDQTTLLGMVQHFTGSDTGNVFTVRDQWGLFLNYLQNLSGFSPFGVHALVVPVLTVLIVLKWRQNKIIAFQALGLLAVLISTSVLLQVLLRFEFRPIKTETMDLLYLPHAIVSCLGLAWLGGLFQIEKKIPKGLIWAIQPALIFAMIFWGFRGQDRRANTMAKDLARDLLASADFGAKVIGDLQVLGFPLLHEWVLGHFRGDVTFYNRRDLVKQQGEKEPIRYGLQGLEEEKLAIRIFEVDQKILNARPPEVTYFMTHEAFRLQTMGYQVVSRGLLLEVFKEESRPNWQDNFPWYKFFNREPFEKDFIERAAFGYAYLARAIQAHGKQDKDTAKLFLKKAREIAPGEQEVQAVSARFMGLLGDLKEAEISLKKAREINPRLQPVAKDLAALYIKQGNLTEAERIVKETPTAASSLKLAMAFEKTGNATKALEYFESANRLGIKDWQIFEKIGEKQYALKNYSRAALAFEESIKQQHPRPFDAKLNLAIANIKADKPQKAISILSKLRKENPNDDEVVSNLAWIYTYQFPDPAKAWRLWETLLVLMPEHPQRDLIEKHLARQKALANEE